MKNKFLIIYIIIIFIGLFYILFLMPVNNKDELEKSNISKEDVYGNFDDMLLMLKKENYEYTYNVIIKTEHYIYEGKKDGNKEQGTVTDKDVVSSYEQIDKIINQDFINPNYIASVIENLDYSLDKYDKIRVYNYETEIDGLSTEIAIYTDYTSITKINITNINEQYSLSYSNIGFTTID